MPDLKSIPDDIKWQLAAEYAGRIPALYEGAFRSVVGEKYDEIEQEIWIKLASMAVSIVRDLALPAKNAHDLAESMRTVMTILFGPDTRSETIEVSEDGAVILIKHCPFLDTGYRAGTTGEQTFSRCMVLTLTTIPFLKKEYAARFVRAMCTGDRQCEIKISPEKKHELTGIGKEKKR